MSKVSVIAKLPVKQGSKDQFLATFESMAKTVTGEEGTELYILNWDTKNDHTAHIYELYRDGDALATHNGSEAMAALIGALGELVDGAPELNFATPAFAKGVEL